MPHLARQRIYFAAAVPPLGGIFQPLGKIRTAPIAAKFHPHSPPNSSRLKIHRRDGALQMRTFSGFFGSIAALAILTAPVLAKNSHVQPPTEEKPAPSPCHTMQRGPDGAWIEMPCREMGAPAQPQPRPTGRSAESAGH
jgi:hypothetical protein